jgi:glutamate N-acetyltransferase/amino-acid N-acetyltransferase
MSINIPGYSFTGLAAGLKEGGELDLGVIHSERPAQAAAVFTRNVFQGAPLIVGKEHIGNGLIQTVVVNSKNANVANGFAGVERSRKVCEVLAEELSIQTDLVFPSSTGVIGRPLPVEKLEEALAGIAGKLSNDAAELFARAIMTTDTVPKTARIQVGQGTVVGFAKGAGMIEPNMATMLAYVLTDWHIPAATLQSILSRVTERTFNCVSVDTDTSTSDTCLLLANGMQGELPDSLLAEFEQAVEEVCIQLARSIARDGEGAGRLLTVDCNNAVDFEQARHIAKLVVNSPLVKTAIKGADPNWGRILMAIGKSFDQRIVPDKVRIFGLRGDGSQLDLMQSSTESLAELTKLFQEDSVHLSIDLGIGNSNCRVWGCDLTEEYIRINGDYTT